MSDSQRSYSAAEGSILDVVADGPSIFDLTPTEEDFLPTLPLTEEINAFLLASKAMASNITTAYDAKRRAEKEAKGQAWQNSRRGTKQATKDRRAAAERPLWEALYYAEALRRLATQDFPSQDEEGEAHYSLEEQLPRLLELSTADNPLENLRIELEAAEKKAAKLRESVVLADPNPEARVAAEATLFLALHAEELRVFMQEDK